MESKSYLDEKIAVKEVNEVFIQVYIKFLYTLYCRVSSLLSFVTGANVALYFSVFP